MEHIFETVFCQRANFTDQIVRYFFCKLRNTALDRCESYWLWQWDNDMNKTWNDIFDEEDGNTEGAIIKQRNGNIEKKFLWKTIKLNLKSKSLWKNTYVDGNIRNQALPVMPRQYQKFFHWKGPERDPT